MKYVLIGGVAILVIFLVVLSFIPIGIEPLTELYLNNHTALPSTISLNKMYGFSFTTHNLEYQEVMYNYSVDAYSQNGTLLFSIDHGNFTLQNNQTKTIPEAFSFGRAFNRSMIQVEITKNLIGTPAFKKKLWWPDPNYPYNIDVHFWVNSI